MTLAFSIFLLLLGTLFLIVAAVLMSVSKAAKAFLAGFPQQIRQMMIDSDPRVQKSLRTLELFPKFSWAATGVGALIFLIGILRIQSHIAQTILLLLAVGVVAAFAKYKDRLVDLIKKQFTDQMQKQVDSRPKPTPAQAKAQFRTMQQTMRDQALNARPPSNRSERRSAQKRK